MTELIELVLFYFLVEDNELVWDRIGVRDSFGFFFRERWGFVGGMGFGLFGERDF